MARTKQAFAHTCKNDKILKTLPDNFNFKAVFEIDSKHICSNDKKQVTTKQNKIKKSRALKRLIKAKKIKDQELWEDIQATENEWLNFSTNYYDVASKKWLDYTTYWSNRIKEKLEIHGIFMSDRDIEELGYTFLEVFYEYELDDFIREYKLSKKYKEV
ncbi:hypothetical protein [Helicobacter bilis]|uniref:hypothetical protein n=1 Tax=Helicobacter bilis TaxID=37372 RepID=UPI000CF01780|nr:hypothetical protein [Helicobacter bilis]